MRLFFVSLLLLVAETSHAHTANKVWFEFRPNGRYRVHVNYTIPEMKEFREAQIEFTRRADAEKYYWDLVRGADFYLPNPASRQFVKPALAPVPW